MSAKRHLLRSAVYVVFERAGKVLLLRRFQTGYCDGSYSLPAGHLDGGEHPTAAAIREAAEEVGLVLKPEQLQFAHVMHRINPDFEYVDFYFTCPEFEGEPRNMEPHKCDELRWVSYDELPDNMIPEVRIVLQHIRDHIPYSEYMLEAY